MGSGLARAVFARGKRAAFGDGKKIHWCNSSEEIYRGNAGVARPGDERSADLEWIPHYGSTRLNVLNETEKGWTWRKFSPVPGEVFLDKIERKFSETCTRGLVIVEPRVKQQYPNKQWPQERYREVVARLTCSGHRVAQFWGYDPPVNGCGEVIRTLTFRQALAVLSRAVLYVGPEGGLHHGAAAVGTRAVVIFGGWAAPWSTGYVMHRNLAASDAGCGVRAPCEHCRKAMSEISAEEVVSVAEEELRRGRRFDS